jgi:hypothetical protein
MRVKSKVKAGGMGVQHNQSVKGLRVKSKVKAGGANGGLSTNHNQAVKGLRVKSKVSAGQMWPINHNQTVRRAR